MTDNDIARVAHEVNRAYCEACGDHSQLPWDAAQDWQKQSCFDGVKYVRDHPSTDPGDTHRNWLAHKAATGWKYGPVKDEGRKEHPCMVPFEELPLEQQVKDHLFVAVVLALSTY